MLRAAVRRRSWKWRPDKPASLHTYLRPEDAIKAIASVSRVVKIGAPFLFTSGSVDGFDGKAGTMNGVTFPYFSYSVDSYRRILGNHGFKLIDVHADSGNNTYYLANKTEPQK